MSIKKLNHKELILIFSSLMQVPDSAYYKIIKEEKRKEKVKKFTKIKKRFFFKKEKYFDEIEFKKHYYLSGMEKKFKAWENNLDYEFKNNEDFDDFFLLSQIMTLYSPYYSNFKNKPALYKDFLETENEDWDILIYKILLNYFNAAYETFSIINKKNEILLTKSGISFLVSVFEQFYYKGKEISSLQQITFEKYFNQIISKLPHDIENFDNFINELYKITENLEIIN